MQIEQMNFDSPQEGDPASKKVGQINIHLPASEETYRVLKSLHDSGGLPQVYGLPVADLLYRAGPESESKKKSTTRRKLMAGPWMGQVPSQENKSIHEAAGRNIDVVLLTAVTIELDAVLRKLRPFASEQFIWRVVKDKQTYFLGRFAEHDVAVTMCTMGHAGRSGAARTTAKAIMSWTPKAIIMVGIAFGRDEKRQGLGDVLVSAQVAYYGQVRVNVDGTVDYRGDIAACGAALLDRFRNTRTWAFERPGGRRCRMIPGQILSGPVLLDNAHLKEALFRHYGSAIGGEMEAVGVYDSASELNTEWIIVKAICDWGDGTKVDNYQDFAAASAVSLVHEVLINPYALEDITRQSS
jgi:nucleoside phosphorylase